LAALHNREIEKRRVAGGGEGQLTEEEIWEVLRKEGKKRKEAAAIYQKAGRLDLAEKENQEWAIIAAYLPPPLEPGEIESLVKAAMSQGLVRFGELMGAVNKAAKGRADPQIIKAVIEKLLANEQRD
jgi:hypothetical protein